jgi:hypothetical protein
MQSKQLIEWLLSSETPSLRYLTRKNLQNIDEKDPLITRDRSLMESTGPIPGILAGQATEGHWKGEQSYYTPKYVSTHWSMLLLHELGLDSRQAAFRRGIDHMLQITREELLQELDQQGHGFSCFWGNLLRYSNPETLENKDRIEPIIEYLCRDSLDSKWRCAWNDELPCAWGAARTLWALAALPEDLRSERVASSIQHGVSFLLEEYELHEANYPTSGKSHPLWKRLNFPLFYQADVLFVLRVMAELGELSHPGTEGAIHWLKGKMMKSGRWTGASPFRQRTWKQLAFKGDTDRWASYFAAYVVKRYEQSI